MAFSLGESGSRERLGKTSDNTPALAFLFSQGITAANDLAEHLNSQIIPNSSMILTMLGRQAKCKNVNFC